MRSLDMLRGWSGSMRAGRKGRNRLWGRKMVLERSKFGAARPRSLDTAAPEPVRLREDELDLLGIFRLLRRNLTMFLLIVVGLTALAMPFLLSIEPLYYARARLMVQEPLALRLKSDDARGAPGIDARIEVERMLSRATVDAVVAKLNLDRIAEFNPSIRPPSLFERGMDRILPAPKKDPLDPLQQRNLRQRIINSFYAKLNVYRDPVTNVIEIGFTSHDPELSAEITNAMISTYKEQRAQERGTEIQGALAWLDQAVIAEQTKLNQTASDVAQFQRSHVLPGEKGETVDSLALVGLVSRLADLRRLRTELSARLAQMEQVARAPETNTLTDTEGLAALNRDRRTQQQILSHLLETYGDNYQGVISARGKIAEINAAVRSEAGARIIALRTRIAAAESEISQINAQLEQIRMRISSTGIAMTELSGLMEGVTSNRTALLDLERRRQQLLLEANLPATSVEVLSEATPPLAPSSRSKKLYLGGVVFGAIFLAMIAVTLRELLDGSLRSHQQLRPLPGFRSAGLLPSVGRVSDQALPILIRRRGNAALRDALQETILACRMANGAVPPQSLLVTGATPRDGASTLALGLATELAALGRQVLLIDGDLRDGNLHRIMGRPEAPGLADLLRRSASFAEVVQRDPTTRINFITCGDLSQTRLADSEALQDLLEDARSRKMVVVFDAGTVLAGGEVFELVPMMDCALLALRWGRTSRKLANLAAERLLTLADNEAAVLSVMTDVNTKRHSLYGFEDAGFSRLAEVRRGWRRNHRPAAVREG
ncbi:hypothetical protein FGG78_23125 [Thioclava sp. BHET1]|nr:hypothetical protein FGG78_23125 [Thioclava sp. BHET1]